MMKRKGQSITTGFQTVDIPSVCIICSKVCVDTHRKEEVEK